jgi:hypothetical protein
LLPREPLKNHARHSGGILEANQFRDELRRLRNGHPWKRRADVFYLSKHCGDCLCRNIVPPLVEKCIAESSCENIIASESKHPGSVKVCFTHPDGGTDFVFLVFKISSGPPYKVITGWQSSSPDMHSEEPECRNELFLRGEIKEPPCKMNAHDRMLFDKQFRRVK